MTHASGVEPSRIEFNALNSVMHKLSEAGRVVVGPNA